ncbi:MAG: ATP-dependent zinc metalloprotease FtsH, partial [Clostridia bacterium]|nr:ATP-dependent zinc metalloprotease FtsH [Clostridia bacterium]
LENVLNEVAILAVRQNKVVIKTNDIDEAIDRVIGGPARHGRVITEEEKRQIASHEAGHALVGLHTKNTEIVQKITIIPRGDAAGYTLQTPQEQERTIQTKEELLNQVRMTLGGRAAEEVIYGESQISTGAANDLYKVSKIVKAMVLSLGMSKLGLTQFVPSEGNVSPLQPKMFSETTARELDLEIEEIIQKEYKKAKEIIIKNRKELDLIVETLMTLETIMKNQIDYIHENLKLPKEVIEFKNKSNNKNNEDNEKDQDDKLDNKKKKD